MHVDGFLFDKPIRKSKLVSCKTHTKRGLHLQENHEKMFEYQQEWQEQNESA